MGCCISGLQKVTRLKVVVKCLFPSLEMSVVRVMNNYLAKLGKLLFLDTIFNNRFSKNEKKIRKMYEIVRIRDISSS